MYKNGDESPVRTTVSRQVASGVRWACSERVLGSLSLGQEMISMQVDKYYDWDEQRHLGAEDARAYEGSSADWRDYAFAIHPAGFPVFLSPTKRDATDEYRDDDPYSVDQHVDSPFHERRYRCTSALLHVAVEDRTSVPRILDLGCGQGHVTAKLRDQYPNAEVSGLDYSVSAIEYAANRFGGIDFAVADAYFPPYAPHYFDVVICNNLWEHVPDPCCLLAAISRVLKPGGHVVISTPSRYRIENLLKAAVGRRVHFNSTLHVTEYSVGQVKEQLAHGGFECRKAYSEPIRRQANTLARILAYKVVLPVLRMYLRAVGSHHSLESTVFFLGRKT